MTDIERNQAKLSMLRQELEALKNSADADQKQNEITLLTY